VNSVDGGRRARTALRTSLGFCEDVIKDIEDHVAKVQPDSETQRLGMLGKVRQVWSASEMAECERRLASQMNSMHIYIKLIRL
jgi:hypothetical protein